MLVTNIPTNIKFTGNQTLINLHVSGSVDITPSMLKLDTINTDTKFCQHIKNKRPLDKYEKQDTSIIILVLQKKEDELDLVEHQRYPSIKIITREDIFVNQYHAT